jgi:hypothetical protein
VNLIIGDLRSLDFLPSILRWRFGAGGGSVFYFFGANNRCDAAEAGLSENRMTKAKIRKKRISPKPMIQRSPKGAAKRICALVYRGGRGRKVVWRKVVEIQRLTKSLTLK